MITGRSSGSGTYSYHETSSGQNSVLVSHMPEDQWKVRIVMRTFGETNIPTLSLNTTVAELLWASLNRMAKDLKWDDRLDSERSEVEKGKR